MKRNKHLLLRKTDLLKTSTLPERKFDEMGNFEKQGLFGITFIRDNVYIYIIVFSCLSSTKPCLRFLLNCFVREIKGFHQSSFRNEVDFRDIMNVSLTILAEN